MVFGSSEKARYDFACDAAKRNDYIFMDIGSKFEIYVRDFFISPINSNKILFYIRAEGISPERLTELLKLCNESPHVFMLSSPSYIFRKNALLEKKLGETHNEIFDAIKALMTIEDRDSVRLMLSDVDVLHLFHTLKFGAWHSPESLASLMNISQYIYKARSTYLISLLAYALPKKAFAVNISKKEKNKLQSSILSSFAKAYKRQNSSEIADLYLLCMKTRSVPEGVELSEEEQKLFGALPKAEPAQEASPEKSPSLTEFF